MVAAWMGDRLAGPPDPGAIVTLHANMLAADRIGLRGTPTFVWREADGGEGRADGVGCSGQADAQPPWDGDKSQRESREEAGADPIKSVTPGRAGIGRRFWHWKGGQIWAASVRRQTSRRDDASLGLNRRFGFVMRGKGRERFVDSFF
jgi:hypothetical protein